nr:MAG TPA: hypothetical protein [Caudoviricetes sp.]
MASIITIKRLWLNTVMYYEKLCELLSRCCNNHYHVI